MVDCPICKGNKGKLAFKKQGYNYFRCKICGLVFIWPQPGPESNSQIYQQWGENHYLNKDKIEVDFSSSFKERLDLIEPYRKNNRILDVGCSTGAFLSAAQDNNWNTYGVEISHPSALHAKNKRNLKVFCGTLKEANYEDGYFDVISIWAVLEHVSEPSDVLREIRRILRKGGLLILCVPNFNCLPVKILGKRYRYIQRGHLFNFSRKSIRKILNESGFAVIKTSSEYFSPLSFIEDLRGIVPNTLQTHKQEKDIINKAKNIKTVFFIFKPFWRFFMFLVEKLNLGEVFTVLATK